MQMSEEKQRLYDILHEMTGIYTEPDGDISKWNNIPDCPIMGSGKTAVAVEGNYNRLTYYISKTDFWYAGGKNVFDYDSGTVWPGYPQYTIQPAALGGLTLYTGEGAVLEKMAAHYCQEQDILHGEIRSRLPLAENESLKIRSFTPLNNSCMLVEISGSMEPVYIKAQLWVHEEEELHTKAGVQEEILWCRSQYRGIWNIEAALGLKVIGASDLRTGTDERKTGTVEFTVMPEHPVWMVVPVTGGKDRDNCEKEAIKAAEHTEKTEIEILLAKHREDWKRYWSKSYVQFHDKDLERFYYGALYELACITDPKGHVPPGIAGGWIHNENPLWSGNYTMNYNAQAPFWGVYSANRAELGMPFVQMVTDYVEEGSKLAREKGTTGILIPVHINPWGTCDLRDTVCQKSNASLAAVNFIWQYEFTKDLDFLKNTAYPFIKECAVFWEDNICLDESGRYVAEDSAQRERWPGDCNTNSDLAHVRKIFDAALKWSRVLNTDEDKRGFWQDVLDKLADYPTRVYEDKIVFKEAENRNQIAFFGPGDNPVNLDHVYPMEALQMQQDECLKITARNTIEVMDSWNQANAFPRIFSQAVRAGWPGEDILKRFKARISQNKYPSEILRKNQTIVPDCHGLEAVGAIEFLNSMLLKSYDQVLRLFPVWPKERNVSFRNLRGQGAFLVSAKLYDSQISDVEIVSEVGEKCILVSPWPGCKVNVSEIKDGSKITVETENVNDVIRWSTAKRGRYAVEMEETAIKAPEAETIKPLMIIPIIAEEYQLKEGQGDGAIDILLTQEKNCAEITADVYMSNGEIRKNYHEFTLSSSNEKVAQIQDGRITGRDAGGARITVLAEVDGVCVSNQITVFVTRRKVLYNLGVETGSRHDGWNHGTPLMWEKECVINGRGMSNPDMTAVKRGNPYGFGMWLTPENPGENGWIMFDLKETVSLDEMWIWNYNCWDDGKEKHIWGFGAQCGLKKVRVYYSVDKEKWTELKGCGYPYQLAKAEDRGHSSATNLDDGESTPIQFEGEAARYVKIVPDKEIGVGNWGGPRYGLSAVRFSVK